MTARRIGNGVSRGEGIDAEVCAAVSAAAQAVLVTFLYTDHFHLELSDEQAGETLGCQVAEFVVDYSLRPEAVDCPFRVR